MVIKPDLECAIPGTEMSVCRAPSWGLLENHEIGLSYYELKRQSPVKSV